MFKIVGKKLVITGKKDNARVIRLAKLLKVTPTQAITKALTEWMKREDAALVKKFAKYERLDKKK